MKVIIASILFVSLVFGDDEFYRTFSGDTLIQVTEVNSRPGKSYKWIIPQGEEYTIGPYAFNGTHIRQIFVNGSVYPSESTLSLEQDWFAGMTGLIALHFSDINIKFNSQNSLPLPGSLLKLKLRNIHLTEVPSEMFTSVPRLQWLILNGNNISTVYPNSFSSLTSLHYLNLSFNGISDIESGAFGGLTTLKSLDLSHNNITITPNIFQDTPELINLNLEKAFNPNEIQLKPGMFDGLNRLTDLTLKGNNFENISMRMFDHLKSLKNLDLSSNNIKTIAPGTFGQSKFDKLFLQENSINVIKTDTFFGLEVNHLHLDQNRIAKLEPRAFYNLTMKELDLSVNELTEIGIHDFDGCKICRLDLRSNRIQNIKESAFKNVTEELRLEMSYMVEGVDKSSLGLEDNVDLILVENEG